MAKKAKKQECPAGEKWAVPYADFLSLLLALFIALYAISAQNKAKVEALKTEFIKIFDATPKPETIQPVTRIPPNPGDVTDQEDGDKAQQSQDSNAVKTVENIVQLEQIIQEGGVLEQIEHGITLQLPSDLLFDNGSAELANDEMKDYLRNMANVIKKFPPQVSINVKGYTDNAPLPPNSPYKNHYLLAAARAMAVMNVLIQQGVNQKQLSFTSYGKNSPIAPNNTPANRAKNNRVEIYLWADPNSVKNVNSILDSSKK
ncbi:flagellar motor protein MotB [Helicobacter mustelae]|uniref:Putative flagellar motor protein n=1 Tax=Helicobacter mustelae (strain ATCC 43772 / CCUG 25715 / CIP 103759 / LMG 18044 / NCTC 12198 / R85-136P) TaxID=679897 RepID=D3UGJ8_HELM1|nr:flagellar motor protein MotB [Helicobacter mustelae]CBG39619.1 putative flagellar motor protein [Helicobacter mustelae 12198]SQH71130.1 flagellar motor protein [Helicobacter mustelae]STP12258.1 flagellar motor protein [Helicobacter mustelae]